MSPRLRALKSLGEATGSPAEVCAASAREPLRLGQPSARGPDLQAATQNTGSASVLKPKPTKKPASVSHRDRKAGPAANKNQGHTRKPSAWSPSIGEHGVWGEKGSRGRERHGPGQINNRIIVLDVQVKRSQGERPVSMKRTRLCFLEKGTSTAHCQHSAWGNEGGTRDRRVHPLALHPARRVNLLLNGLK